MSAAWVRLPPGALDERGDPVAPDGPLTPLWCIGEHATLSKWKDGFNSRQGRSRVSSFKFRVSGFKLENLKLETRHLKLIAARYANRKSDQAQTLEKCGFDSHPCYCECVGRRWDAGRPVKPPHTARQVRFLTGALVFGPFVYRQDIGFSAREAGFNSPTDYWGATPTAPRPGDVAQLEEAAVSEAARCGFDSHRHH
jgi:hypothetical protein